MIHGLTYALVLHPVAAGVALIAIIVSLTNHVVLDICGSFIGKQIRFFNAKRSAHTVLFIIIIVKTTAGLAFMITLTAFIIDSILFIEARHRINQAVSGTPASLSNCYWMVLVAMICLLIATFTVCFGSQR